MDLQLIDMVKCPGFLHFLLNVYGVVAYGVVVSIYVFYRCDQGSNPGLGGKISYS